jgi:outer membrane protein OmpA-like peptidoglycan-associated protein
LVTSLKRLWWVVPVILSGLLLLSWALGRWVVATAQESAAEEVGVPPDQVEMVDGLNVHLTGFATAAERDEAITAVAALDSSWRVTGEVLDPGESSVPVGETDGFVRDRPVGRPPEVTLTADDDRLSLGGTVATQRSRDRLVELALQLVDSELFDDYLVIDSDDVAGQGGTLTLGGDRIPASQYETWLPLLEEAAAELGMELIDQAGVGSIESDLNELFDQQPLVFEPRSSQLTETSLATLDLAVELLAASPGARFLVVGHTDSDGDAQRNLELSQQRADEVVSYLVEQGGIRPNRLEAEGRGETELEIDPELTLDDKERNRRIDWELLP